MIRLLALLLACVAIGAAWAAWGEPPPGTDLSSPKHLWFEQQHSVKGAWCCSLADGHVLNETDWRIRDGRYEVFIGKSWYPINPDQMVDPTKGGENPTGHAIVWFVTNDYGLTIYCFCPGTML